MTRYERKAFDEIEKVRRNTSCYIIMRNGEIKGRITARNTNAGAISHISLEMFNSNILDSEIIKGYGFDREEEGICTLLSRNSKRFADEWFIKGFHNPIHILMRHWQDFFSLAGFSVIQAL